MEPYACSGISLGEGNTPLVSSRRLGALVGLPRLFFKVETANPTGSYKDRFAAAAVSDMVAAGKSRCIATSSGNTGAALAAYCAAAGLGCEVALVETAPDGKLHQMAAYGAVLRRVRGFGLDPEVTAHTFERLRELGDRADASLQISAYCFSAIGMAGVEAIGHEIHRQSRSLQLESLHVFVPAGGGGLTLAVARGLAAAGSDARVHCVQPRGNDTIAGPLRDGQAAARAVTCTTSISGLQVPTVLDGDATIAACRRSGGTGYTVDDQEVFALQSQLARQEGVFCEPAGAVALCGAIAAARGGEIPPGASIVCLVTGSAFKDPPSLQAMAATACPAVDWRELV